MLNYEFPPIGGGAGRAHLCLLKEYAGREDLVIDVLTSAPKPGFFVEKFADNITIYKVGVHKKNLHYWHKTEVVEWLFKAWFAYRRLLKANSYDLSHAFFGFPTGLFSYLSASKLPYVISLRGSDVPGYNSRLRLDYKLLSPLFTRIWRKSSLVVANSEGLRKLAKEFMPDLDVRVIPNGIDTSQFYPPEKRSFREPVKLLTVGRLISRKRTDLLIKAVDCAQKAGLSVHFTIVGDGNLLKSLQKLVDELGISPNITFAGRVSSERMPRLYRDNDILIMSSVHEGMSNAMLEAMACGLPIITTGCEGVEELISDNGVVVETDSANEIAEAIGKLAKDKQMCTQMSIASRKRAALFSWKSMAEEYLNHAREITRKKAKINAQK